MKDNYEIESLSNALNELHLELVKSIEKVNQQYQEVMIAKKHQDVFIVVSSHQLKTPVAAALLVLDGMINNVGKYQDHSRYLDVVKKELININDIIELDCLKLVDYSIE